MRYIKIVWVIMVFAILQMIFPEHIRAVNKDDLFLRIKEAALGINKYSLEYDLNDDGKADVFDVIRIKQERIAIYERIDKLEADVTALKESNAAKIRIASANVGDFSGVDFTRGNGSDKYRKTLAKMKADIICTQEDLGWYDAEGKHTLPVTEIYGMYKYNERMSEGDYNYHSIMSHMPIQKSETKTYVTREFGTYKLTHRYYQHGVIYIGNKEVHIMNIHLEWADKNARASQIAEILDFASQFEYCIIIGDFNPMDYIDNVKQSDNMTYKEELAVFESVGFTPANAGYFGVYNTFLRTFYEPLAPFDNILVTNNMMITNVEVFADDWMNDHAYIAADIVIY